MTTGGVLSIDARWLVGGIGTYIRQLLRGLSSNESGFQIRAITREAHKRDLEEFCKDITVVNHPIYTVQEQWAIPRAAKGCDLLHVPHYNVPLLQRTPVVATVHDIIHLTDPEYRNSYKSWVYARPILKLATQKAKHIVTVSDYSKSQISEQLGVPPSKITTIHNGVNSAFQPMDRDAALALVSNKVGVKNPYILYVGSFKKYKNVPALLEAFSLLSAQEMNHDLILVGDDATRKRELINQANALGIAARIRFLPFVQQSLLPALYAAADLYVMPSKIEGFGLPVLEAMACGTPVVCSHATALPEVGGDAVLYFDPEHPEDLADAMKRILQSHELRCDLRHKGIARAKRFTWQESARKHVAVYQQVLHSC